MGRRHRIANRVSRVPPFLVKKQCCSIHLPYFYMTKIPLNCIFHLQIPQGSPKRGNVKKKTPKRLNYLLKAEAKPECTQSSVKKPTGPHCMQQITQTALQAPKLHANQPRLLVLP